MGARDVLVNTHQVVFGDKAWVCNNSVESDEYPVGKQLRVLMPLAMFYFKPNPMIQGYTLMIISEFNFGGSIPNSMVGPASLKASVQTWAKA